MVASGLIYSEVYTTTITESGSTFLSLVTTTRTLPGHDGGVVTLIGPGTQTTAPGAEFAPITVTETIMEWYPRKHYHQDSDEPCYKDDEEEEDDNEEDCDEDEDRYDDPKDRYQNE